jgi:tetratricopeptide (TPR) repeat protein
MWPPHGFICRMTIPTNAAEELKAALKQQSQRHAEALALMGKIAVDHYDFDTADAVVDAIRTEKPQSIDGRACRNPQSAAAAAAQAGGAGRSRCWTVSPIFSKPGDCSPPPSALQLHDDATKQLLADVDKAAPTDAGAYYEVAEQLGAMRQYPRAAAMYQVAIARAPWWSNARNGLGLLYTQSGDEDLARVTLDAAHKVDPFNVETTNYLRLLDTMKGYDPQGIGPFHRRVR